MTTKTRIVRIGNSRGIRVPKILLDQAQLPDEVELHAEPGRVERGATSWGAHVPDLPGCVAIGETRAEVV